MSDCLEGGCFCGAVRYAVRAIFDAGYCHCSICRRTSGAPVLAWASVPATDFKLLRGAPKELRTSAHCLRQFCADCGTHLFFRDERSSGDALIGFHVATLDHANAVRPRVHLFAQDRIEWFDTADDLPRFPDNRIPHPDRR